MNNEPVAWQVAEMIFDIEESAIEMAKVYGDEIIPLYTHPVKEQDTDCQYCKQGCIRCDARKQLTDEEINDIAQQCWVYPQGDQAIFNQHKFARAILRKAQKK